MRTCPASALHVVYLRDPLKLQIDLINDRTQSTFSMNLFLCKHLISFSFQIWCTLDSLLVQSIFCTAGSLKRYDVCCHWDIAEF